MLLGKPSGCRLVTRLAVIRSMHNNSIIGSSGSIMEIAMNYSYWRPERLVLADGERRAPRTMMAWGRVVSVLTSADLLALTIFCMIGLLVSLAVILAFPSFSETIEALQQYF